MTRTKQPDIQITPSPVEVQPGDMKIPLTRVIRIVTATILVTAAALGLYYGFVMRMGATEIEVKEHTTDTNAHIPQNFYRDNGLPLGERKAEKMLEQVQKNMSQDVAKVVEQKFGEVADMIEDAHGGDSRYRQKRRARARAARAASP